MGKLAFLSFCSVAFLIVMGIDFAQQRGLAHGSFGPGEYFYTIKKRIGLGAETYAAATDEGQTATGRQKQDLPASGVGRTVLGKVVAGTDSVGDVANAKDQPPIVNRPAGKVSNCGAGKFCGAGN
ncbi:hypothetical protein [Seohaeicola zhoushanensis]|uniref:Uncharacterized protein n=1 Tax=Seohaeicola zhoushanensis TaxID=1569283 RepID=A0A8J3GUV8_9RHOB|nr:hypothetical protein [Seohaeicola zhoushanensis]GHF36507.1 hypothetical protein GCM10017056_05440 [Seohaeicola zhoushanensis]